VTKTKIYINGEIIGTCDEPENFVEEMREKRRKGKVSHEMNITYYPENNEIHIFTDPGRARRPLIVVKKRQTALKRRTPETSEGRRNRMGQPHKRGCNRIPRC